MRYFVVCDEYRAGPFRTEADARRKLDGIEAAGHCSGEHRIEAV